MVKMRNSARRDRFDMQGRDRFLSRLPRNPHLDAIDREAIREGMLLRSLKSHQHNADEIIGVLYKNWPVD